MNSNYNSKHCVAEFGKKLKKAFFKAYYNAFLGSIKLEASFKAFGIFKFQKNFKAPFFVKA